MTGAGDVATGERVICNTRGPVDCTDTAQFSITAAGYPLAMFEGVCAYHLGVILAGDVAAGGSTGRWIVEAL